MDFLDNSEPLHAHGRFPGRVPSFHVLGWPAGAVKDLALYAEQGQAPHQPLG